MSTTLKELYSPDILSHVFSFLPLESIAMMERSCKQFTIWLRTDYIDKTIYYKYICQLFKLDLDMMKDDTSSWYMFDQFLQKENCRELLAEFFRAPFIGKSVTDNFHINSYLYKGGVIDFSIYVPCKLLKGLLNHCKNDLDENFKRTLHKFLLFAGISFWNLKMDTKFHLAKLNSEQVLQCNENPYSNYNLFPFTEYSVGKGLLMVLNNLFDFENYTPAISVSGMEHGSLILYNELIQNAEPPQSWADIFLQCADPPYTMQPANEEVRALTSQLYNDHYGSCEHYSWNAFLYSEWSSYWIAGSDWWGCFSLTTYDYTKQRFVIATASSSD